MTYFKDLFIQFKVPRGGEGWGDRKGVDSSSVVSVWIAHVTEGRARVDGKEENERERLCPHSPNSPPALFSLILSSLRNGTAGRRGRTTR